MNPKDDLFQLIKSLTKNEKRYFKLNASIQKGDKVYLKLFDEISRQQIYDEGLIKEKFKNKKLKQQLSFTKLYLYRLIMKCLIHYNENKPADLKISEMIAWSKILFSKALFPQYFKTLSRAKELALKYERFGYLIEILDLERLIVKKEQITKKDGKKIYSQANDSIEKARNIFDYSLLLHRSFRIHRSKGSPRNKIIEDEVSSISRSPLMRNEKRAVSLRARESFYKILEVISEIKGDHRLLLKNAKLRLDLIENNRSIFEGHIINYRKDVLRSLLLTLAETGRYNKVEEYLQMFSNATVQKDEIEKVNDFAFSAILTLDMYTKTKNPLGAVKLIPEIENKLEGYKHKIDIDTELFILFKIIKLMIMAKDFEGALGRINRLLVHPQLQIRADLECQLKLLSIVVHFELGNYKYLEYLLKSTHRYLYKRERLYKLETLFLNFIRRILQMETNDLVIFNLEKLRNELAKLKEDRYEKKVFEYFDFVEWVDSKIKSSRTKSIRYF